MVGGLGPHKGDRHNHIYQNLDLHQSQELRSSLGERTERKREDESGPLNVGSVS